MNNANDRPMAPLDFDPFAAGALERVIPTTEAQREVWLADQLSPQASLAYNESIDLQLDGPLDLAALRTALDQLVARHDALRASFSADGLQLLIAEAAPLALPLDDLSAQTPADAQAALARSRLQAVETPFHLAQGPLFRATLHRLGAQQHLLQMTAHHAVCDGWSWGVLCDELGQLYAAQLGAAPALAAAPSYADYAAWESAQAAAPQMQQHLAFWRDRFAGSALPVLELPLDHPRAPLRSFASRRIDEHLDATLVAAVRKLGAHSGSSLFATLFSVFAATLHQLSQQGDLVIGVPSAGQSVSELPGLVGHCVNLLPIRVAVDPELALDALVRQSSGTLLDAFEHQTLTYGTLLQQLPLPRDPSRPSLVSVMFNLDRETAPGAHAFASLQARITTNPRQFENFELFLNALPAAGGLQLELQYNTALFDEGTVRRWLALYRSALERFVQQPDMKVAEALAPTAQDTALLASFNATAMPFDAQLRIDTLIARQAAATPHAVAVIAGEVALSYRELDQRANALALALHAQGAGPGDLVGLSCARNEHMLVALLGILKSGAGYVPLDPSFPPERLAFMRDDARLRHVVADASTAASWQATPMQLLRADTLTTRAVAPAPIGSAQDVAYVIYTSGSTGRPKGVRVSHRNVVNLLTSLRQVPGITADHTTLAVTTLSFDIAVSEVLLPLTLGARIVVADPSQAREGEPLRALVERHDVRFIDATPATWRLLLEAGWPGRADLLAVCTGEPLPPDLAQQLLPRVGALWNGYGPTETTVWSSFYRVDQADGPVPIGRPIGNTEFHVLDTAQRPLPVGVTGELCIAGAGVTLGYLERPELDAERFVRVPGASPGSARWYRTGDLGRWRADGILECLGRTDHQVKVRGFRIELGEIEAHLARHPGVDRCLVATREDVAGDVRIVAYVVPRGPMPEVAALKQHLAGFLPEYMQPQHFAALDALPLLPNGKTDRQALPAPQRSPGLDPAATVAPRNTLERQVLGLMEAVLSLPGISIHDDFFALGGHSLLAARLTAQLGREFGMKVPMATLFEAPTAARLAEAVRRLQTTGPSPAPEAIAAQPGRLSAPLTPMQERIRFLEALHPGRSVYNAPSGHRLGGPLNGAYFEAALREIVQRQATLRSHIDTDAATGAAILRIAPQLDLELPVFDLRDRPAQEREAELLQRMQALADEPFDLYHAPLFRAALYRLGDEDHAFLFVPHHLIWDGWSFDLFQAELSTLYRARVEGRPHGLPELPVSHADYAHWHARWLQQPDFQRQLDFWKQRFAAAPPPVALPTDRPRRAGMSGEGGNLWIHIDQGLTERLREVARQQDLTLSMLTFAVYVLMMANLSTTHAIVVATPVRGREAPELEHVMGFFNNLLPLSFQLDPSQPCDRFLRYVKGELLAVMNYQQVPFERLVSEPEFAERVQGAGLYQALFSFQDARARPADIGGLVHRQIHLRQRGATDDLGLWLMDKPHGLEGAVGYNADIYTEATGAAFRDRYLELLAKVAAQPTAALSSILATGDSLSAALLQQLGAQTPPANMPPATAPALTPSAEEARPGLLLPEQARLAQVWASALGIDVNELRASDNFFDLGGDSLLAMRVVEQSAQTLGFRVEPRRYVFENLGQLASPALAAPSPEARPAGEPAADTALSPPPARGGLLGRVFAGWGRKG